MNIEQTIKYYENLAEINKGNIVPKEDYRNMPWIDESNEYYKKMTLRYSQISEWLKELKAYRNMWDKVIDELQKLADEEWNKKVDINKGLEFAIEIIEEYKKEIEE